ncbi:MAG: hypothetical protein KDB80_18635 [Planctomycetes bacterium]|nr:hypothetical protein [Planctomycetota bacterium]
MADTIRWQAVQKFALAVGTVVQDANVHQRSAAHRRAGETDVACFYGISRVDPDPAQHYFHDEAVQVQLVVEIYGDETDAVQRLDRKVGLIEKAVLTDADLEAACQQVDLLSSKWGISKSADAKFTAVMDFSLKVRRLQTDPFATEEDA